MDFEQIKECLLDSIAEHFNDIAEVVSKTGFDSRFTLCTSIKFNSVTCLCCEMVATMKDSGDNLFYYVIRVYNRSTEIWLSMSWIGEAVDWFVANDLRFAVSDDTQAGIDNFLRVAKTDISNAIKAV